MICPLMLKQSNRTEKKNLEEWERQPCLEEACSLYFGRKKKCALFYNSETTHEVRKILDNVDFVASFQVLQSGLEAAREGFSEEVQGLKDDVDRKLSTLESGMQEFAVKTSQEMEDRVTQHVQKNLEEMQSLASRMEQGRVQWEERLQKVEERILDEVQQGRQMLLEMGAVFQGQLDRIASQVGKVLDRGHDLGETMCDDRLRMETRLQEEAEENRGRMSELLSCHEEIRTYYVSHQEQVNAAAEKNRRETAREHNNRGVVFFHRGAQEAAARAFEKAVELDPEYAEAYNNLGLVYTELQRAEHAVQAFTRAIALRPEIAEARNNLGLLYYSNLDYAKATEMFSQALKEGCRDRSMVYTNFGNSLYQLERYPEALSAWEKALSLNPLNRNARKGLSLLKQQTEEVG